MSTKPAVPTEPRAAPVEDIRFRGSYQRAVRSPNIQELFLKPRVQLNSNGDPCASLPGDAPEASLEECIRSGVTPGQYGNILANPAAIQRNRTRTRSVSC